MDPMGPMVCGSRKDLWVHQFVIGTGGGGEGSRIYEINLCVCVWFYSGLKM